MGPLGWVWRERTEGIGKKISPTPTPAATPSLTFHDTSTTTWARKRTCVTALKEEGEGWKPRVLTIYMGNSESPVGESNGSRYSVWKASENMGCDRRRWNISTLQLIWIYFMADSSPTKSNSIVCLCRWFLVCVNSKPPTVSSLTPPPTRPLKLPFWRLPHRLPMKCQHSKLGLCSRQNQAGGMWGGGGLLHGNSQTILLPALRASGSYLLFRVNIASYLTW